VAVIYAYVVVVVTKNPELPRNIRHFRQNNFVVAPTNKLPGPNDCSPYSTRYIVYERIRRYLRTHNRSYVQRASDVPAWLWKRLLSP